MKRIVFSDQAKADIRAIPQRIAMNILAAIQRLAETGTGHIRTLQDQDDWLLSPAFPAAHYPACQFVFRP